MLAWRRRLGGLQGGGTKIIWNLLRLVDARAGELWRRVAACDTQPKQHGLINRQWCLRSPEMLENQASDAYDILGHIESLMLLCHECLVTELCLSPLPSCVMIHFHCD